MIMPCHRPYLSLWTLLAAVALCFISLRAACADTPASPVAILRGGRRVAALPAFAIDPAGQVKLRLLATPPEGEKELASDLIVQWGNPTGFAAGEIIILHAGQLRADSLTIAKDHLQIGDASGLDRLLWKTSTIDRNAVRGILFQPPGALREQATLLREIAEGSRDKDVLLLKNGSRLKGTLLGRNDVAAPMEGSSSFSLQREPTQPPLSIPADRVVAWLAVGNTKTESPPNGENMFWLGLEDGSRLHVQQLEALPRRDANAAIPLKGLNLKLADETQIELTFAQPVDTSKAITAPFVYYRPRQTSVFYFSSASAPQYKYVPWLSLASGPTNDWPMAWGQGLQGDELQVAGKHYLQGLAMHSASRAVFDLEPGYKSFSAELGIEDSAAPQGSVTGQVLLQRPNGKWESVFQSPTVRHGEAPKPIFIPLGDAVRLTLVVDYADAGDVGDHALWLDPRLEK